MFAPSNINDWEFVSIDLSAAIASAGISFDSDFHIKFQHYGTGSAPTFGRGFDDIRISTVHPNAHDTYEFSLDDGQTITVVYDQFSGSSASLNLYDSSGGFLTSATAGPTNVDRVITSFTDSTSDGSADAYRMKVVVPRGDYSLTVTRDATFDLESNSTTGTAQALSPNGVVLGHIDSSADADGDFYSFSLVSGQVAAGASCNAICWR